MPTTKHFNPLIPSGMRLRETNSSIGNFVFQSTHPKRDETGQQAGESSPLKFQSTHPKRDETSFLYFVISFIIISIHSSQAGWDVFLFYALLLFLDFNPLIPSGMRLSPFFHNTTKKRFQSTHPKRDETSERTYTICRERFQSTHPKRDETGKIKSVRFFYNISIHSSQAGWDFL